MAYSDKVIEHYNHPRNVEVCRRKTRTLEQDWLA